LIVHDFRRSAIRNLILAGVPQKVVMDISGHETISVFLRYNITSPEQRHAAMESLAGGGSRKRSTATMLVRCQLRVLPTSLSS